MRQAGSLLGQTREQRCTNWDGLIVEIVARIMKRRACALAEPEIGTRHQHQHVGEIFAAALRLRVDHRNGRPHKLLSDRQRGFRLERRIMQRREA